MSKNDGKPLAWQQKTSQVMYENPWIRVSHDEVITPANT
jgi:hypothetical protein